MHRVQGSEARQAECKDQEQDMNRVQRTGASNAQKNVKKCQQPLRPQNACVTARNPCKACRHPETPLLCMFSASCILSRVHQLWPSNGKAATMKARQLMDYIETKNIYISLRLAKWDTCPALPCANSFCMYTGLCIYM